jgi:tRNA(Ile)-lysidine synthase
VHSLAERVLAHIRRVELLRPGDRIGVAVSGGIDSVALLRLLLELRHDLGIVLSVVHFNHKLRGAEAEADQEFVSELAHEHGLEFYLESGDVAGRAAADHSGVEAAARELRYGFFGNLLGAEVAAEDGSEDSTTSATNPPNLESADRNAGSAAPPKSFPQGLKPERVEELNGTAEAVPFPNPVPGAAEGALVQSEATLVQREGARFQSQNGRQPLDKIATGHTLDDQAETVLMRLIRGTGPRGLGGIYPRITVEQEGADENSAQIIRPLLATRRRELEQYLNEIHQPWREDSSNAESKFTRNRVRKLVLPLLEREFNPNVAENLAELAEIARDEEDYWENEISGWLGTVVQWSPAPDVKSSLVQIRLMGDSVDETPEASGDSGELNVLRFARDDNPVGGNQPESANISVSRPWLLTEPKAVQRRVIKAIGEQAGVPLEFKHVEEILRFAEEDGPPGKELSLPLGWKILREPEAMVFVAPDWRRRERLPDYEYVLKVPGRVVVAELGGVIEALRVGPEPELAEYNPQQLLRAESLPGELTIRNWRAGDRFWPAHTKAAKKVKELLQERHVSGTERSSWPVAVSEGQIVWMRGFPVPASSRAKAGEGAVMIREISFAADELEC